MHILTLDTSTRFHMLRHFSSVTPSYITTAFPDNIQDAAMEQLALHRSKFLPVFAADPDVLVDKLREIPDELLVRNEKSDRADLLLEFTNEQYIDGIGTDSIISLESIDHTVNVEWKQPEAGPQDYRVAYAALPCLPPTFILNACFSCSEDALTLITAFPGTPAPPLPDHAKHSPAEYAEFDSFWKSHAFIM